MVLAPLVGVTQSNELVGQIVEERYRYRIEAALGAGGTGSVYELIDSHPGAATDILFPQPRLPRLPSHAPIAMAATLEAPRTAGPRRPKPNRPWRPWRELGVVVGIALATIALAARPAPRQQQLAVELELALPAQQIAVTAVSMEAAATEALH